MITRKIRGNWVVRCAYYTRVAHHEKGEQTVIYFDKVVGNKIDASRVILIRDGSKMMFKPVDVKVPGSYAISDGRIQVTAGASKWKDWVGLYATLRHDDTTNWYYIDYTEAAEDVNRYNAKSSKHSKHPGHKYTPYVIEDLDVAADNRVANDETLAERVEYQPTGTGNKTFSDDYDTRVATLISLTLDFVRKGQLEPAQACEQMLRETMEGK